MSRIVALFLGFGVAGCLSNPTPHPADDVDTSRGDSNMAPSDEESCEAIGGVWAGSSCFTSGNPDSDVHLPDPVDGDGVGPLDVAPEVEVDAEADVAPDAEPDGSTEVTPDRDGPDSDVGPREDEAEWAPKRSGLQTAARLGVS